MFPMRSNVKLERQPDEKRERNRDRLDWTNTINRHRNRKRKGKELIQKQRVRETDVIQSIDEDFAEKREPKDIIQREIELTQEW